MPQTDRYMRSIWCIWCCPLPPTWTRGLAKSSIAPSRAGSTAAPHLCCRSGPRSVHIWPSAWQAAQRTYEGGG
jgi:hypothetical protein